MKIVLDTNVLISGILYPFNPPGEIVRMVSARILSLCYDIRILLEYQDVLNRPKFNLKPALVIALLDQIQACGQRVTSSPLDKRLPDPKDEPFLEVAIAGKARCLITGNLKDYPSSYSEVKILSPSQFLDFYRQSK